MLGGRTAKFLLNIILAVNLSFNAFSALPAAAEETSASRKVKVGFFTINNFQEYDQGTDVYRGYSYDYMMALAQYANWEFEFVPVTYDEGIKKLQNGELDLMNYVNPDNGYDNLSYSTLASGESWINLVVPLDNNTVSYEDFDAIGELTVGLVYENSMNASFVDYCKDNDCLPTIIYYHSTAELQKAMTSGEINSYLVSSLSDVNMRTVAKFATSSYYLATYKGNNDVLSELNKAMNALKTDNPYYQEILYSRYHTESTEEETIISTLEKEYITNHGAINVVCLSDWYPVCYRGSYDECSGAVIALLREIGSRTGLQFTFTKVDTIKEAQASIEDGTYDVIAGFPYDYAWAADNHTTLTLPFASMNMMQVTSGSSTEILTAAVPENSYQEYFTREIESTGYTYYRYHDISECLQAVKSGTVDCALIDAMQAEYYQKRYSYRGLKYQSIAGGNFQIALAVADTADPMLLSILNKSISSIGSQQISQMFEDASQAAESRSLIDQVYSNSRFAAWFFTLLGFILAAIISLIIYGRRMKIKNQQIQEAVAAKSDFLSNMSHDMRTPLNGIIGYTNLAMDEDNQPVTQDYLKKVKISGEFLLSLINDTLDISKIESGKFTLKPETVNSNDLLESIVVPIQAAAEKKNIKFHMDLSGIYSGYIVVDSLNLKKVILNLLSNAIKFTPEGGEVNLVVSEIEAVNGCNCRIIVKDNGIGISPEFQTKMFEPFTQEGAPQARSAVGTGLGLSIVKRIVTLMNGTIEVKSELNKGSQFTVLVPIQHAEKDAGAVQVRSVEDKGILQGRKVLLCEDNEMNAEIASTILKSFGMMVDTAETGKEGVKIFTDSAVWNYDLILMDRRMPEMDGLEAARRIRAMNREDAGSIPIIAMSADVFDESIQEFTAAGMNSHVDKPIDRMALEQELISQCEIEDALRKHEVKA